MKLGRYVPAFGLLLRAAAQLTMENINPNVVAAEYAVRGRLLTRAGELRAELAAGNPNNLPFNQIVHCNIGNPQALGQKPLTFVREVLGAVVNPALLESGVGLSPEARARAQAYLGAVAHGSVGAYTESQGITLVRQEVAEFINRRDGASNADPDDIFLTDGASSGVKALMQLLVRSPDDAILVPIPQYPLYSALSTLLNGTMAGYFLDEASAWGVHLEALDRVLKDTLKAGKTVRAVVVINPGNPTGQSLPAVAVEAIMSWAAANGLVVLADEVYQENVYGAAPPFTSFRAAYETLSARPLFATLQPQLVSFHSTSKGVFGECGLRGGYFEARGLSPAIKAELLKLQSISLCSNAVGQIATGLLVKPPPPGTATATKHAAEEAAIKASLAARATRLASALNRLEGVACNPAEGAMYLFPQITLPPGALAAAAASGAPADEFYCLRLLESTGLVVVPGSGFGQQNGTWHFRTTFLPPDDQLDDVLGRLGAFHAGFLATYATGRQEL